MPAQNRKSKFPFQMIVLGLALLGAGCQQSELVNKTPYPTNPSGRDPYEKKETIWGDTSIRSGNAGGGIGNVFAGSGAANGAVLGVNAYLWRASLDTVSFMPIASADPFGGTILTEWYSTASAPDERFKLNIIIMDAQLRADSVRVSLFRQERDGKQWRDASVDRQAARDLENTILTRARALKVAQEAAK